LTRIFRHRFAPPLVLTVATLVWGVSFVITRGAVQDVPPLLFVGLRFGTAAVLVATVTRPRMFRLTRTEVSAGGRIAIVMFGSYGVQAIAMHLGVTSGRAAFISALYVPIVPLLQLLILKRQPSRSTWAGIGLALAGLLLMAGPLGHEHAGATDLLMLVSAVSIASEILLIGRYALRVDPRRLTVVECAALALICLAATALTTPLWPKLEPAWILSALGLGLASAGLQIAANWAQRFVPPAQAALLYTMEPVWAALFGAMAGERMSPMAMAGGALILASLVVSRR
jgi:drug/metabolite transporter (DMT)-like permease